MKGVGTWWGLSLSLATASTVPTPRWRRSLSILTSNRRRVLKSPPTYASIAAPSANGPTGKLRTRGNLSGGRTSARPERDGLLEARHPFGDVGRDRPDHRHERGGFHASGPGSCLPRRRSRVSRTFLLSSSERSASVAGPTAGLGAGPSGSTQSSPRRG